MLDASLVENFFTQDFVEFCKFYLITFAVGFIIGTALCLAWVSTGLAPLDYYVWLVQLSQSPGRRIIQVFTMNNEIDEGSRASLNDAARVGLSSDQNVSLQENQTPNNDQDSEQTTVVIIQTPYSVTRFADDTNDNRRFSSPAAAVQLPDSVSGDGLTRTFRIEVPNTVSAQVQAPLQSSNLTNLAGIDERESSATAVSGSANNANTISNVIPSGQEDINAIFRVLRANTDSAIATAATIALYSRELSTSSNPSGTAVPQQQQGVPGNGTTISPSSSSQSASDGERRREDANSGGRHQLLVSRVSMSVESSEETSDLSQGIFISYDNLRAIPTQDVFSPEFIPNFNTSSFLDSSSTVSSSSFSSSTSTSSSWTTGGSMTATTTNSGESNVTSFVHVDELGHMAGERVVDALDESAPSTSGIFSAENSQCSADSSAVHDTVEVEKKEQNEEKRWESALTTIRLKFLDDTQRLAKTWLDTSVGDFKRRYFSESLDSGKVVRLIFQGQLLRDDSRSLESYGIHDQCAVHCHVGSRPYAQQNNSNEATDQARQGDAASHPAGSHPLSGANAGNGNGISLGGRLMSAGTSWMEIFSVILWSGLVYLWNWAQNVDENNNNEAGNAAPNSIRQRVVEQLRNFVRIVLSCLFDASLFVPNRRRAGRRQRLAPDQNTLDLNDNFFGDDENNYRFNAGTIFGLLVAMKITTLWILVIYFPQFADFKCVFFLGILTLATAMYFFFNHVNDSVRITIGGNTPNNAANLQQWQWQRATIGRQ